jgi:DNA-binding CsgD family transcriptional regulator
MIDNHGLSLVPENTNSSKFLQEISNYVSETPAIPKSLNDFDVYESRDDQVVYVLDYNKIEMVHQKGFKKILGYSGEEVDFDLVLNRYLHPLQKRLLHLIINACVHCTVKTAHSTANTLSVVHKAQKKNGQYITVLRRTRLWECDEKGSLVSTISVITDLTGILDADEVQWKWDGPDETTDKIKEFIHQGKKAIFSKREIDVLREIKLRKTSQEIADYLNISKHTVDTHRRNMLKKVGAKNTLELIGFSKMSGF